MMELSVRVLKRCQATLMKEESIRTWLNAIVQRYHPSVAGWGMEPCYSSAALSEDQEKVPCYCTMELPVKGSCPFDKVGLTTPVSEASEVRSSLQH